MVRGFDFSREAFEENLERIIGERSLMGMYDVTTTMLDRGKKVSDRVYFIPFDLSCNLVIYSTVDVFTDRSPVEATSRWDVEMYWVFEGVYGSYYQLFYKLDRTYDMFDVMDGVFQDACCFYSDNLRDRVTVGDWLGFEKGFPYE